MRKAESTSMCNFQALFGHVIDRVTNATTLRHAKLFMEAFMAFYRVWRSN